MLRRIKVFAALMAVSMGTATAQDLNWDALVHDGVERDFGWYAGVGVGAAPAPVVLMLHGGGGNADQVWTGDDGMAWRRLADDRGLILLLPEGRLDPGTANAHHWNDCRTDLLEPSVATTSNDVGFLRAVVEWTADRWTVDRDRVYVTGASNGGMMSFRMAMEASNLLAAAAPIIANLPEPSECGEPSRAVPMLIMNGTEDPLMPWDGGCVASRTCERGAVMSTEDTVAYWVRINAIRTDPTCVDLPDTVPEDGSTVTVCTYVGGTAESEVVLYRVDGGGHSVPGPNPLPWWYRLVVGPRNRDIVAADEVWTFFERHTRRLPAPRRPGARVGG
jgi:polyhydroxybutyrate depolymerase